MTPPPIGQYKVCPQGLFVSVESLQWADQIKLFGGPREWLDAIIRDFSQPPNRIEFLALQDIATGNPDDGSIRFLQPELDLIKDYFPKFDYLVVGGIPEADVVKDFDITNANHRSAYLNASLDVAGQFVHYLVDNDMNHLNIHWYIFPEGNLSLFGSASGAPYVNAFKAYISSFTNHATELSQANGLNLPEFLWSPYFWQITEGSVDKIRDFLLSVPKLSWMHVIDAVGAKAVKNTTTGEITYERYIDQVVNYFNQFIIPAAQQAHLKSLRVNLEMYVFDDHRNVVPAPPAQRAHSQLYYKQHNIQLGCTWEIRHWYASLYYREVPYVKGKNVDSAQEAIQNDDLVPIINGPTISAEVTDVSPPVGDFVRPRSNVTLTTAHIVGPPL
jgi:hypothetical protein